MVDDEAVHVALAPAENVDTSLVKAVARALKRDSYDTRLVLARRIPTIIASYRGIETAESVARTLTGLGPTVIVCRDSELQRLSPAFTARTLEFGEAHVTFTDSPGQVVTMEPPDVFLILKGTMQISEDAESTSTRMKFSPGATLLTGGIPMWRPVRERTRSTSTHSSSCVRLYQHQPHDPSVEIVQDRMDYSFLGASMASSSAENLDITAARLRERFPQAVYDDRLTRPFAASELSDGAGGGVEIDSKLVYLFHLAATGRGPAAWRDASQGT